MTPTFPKSMFRGFAGKVKTRLVASPEFFLWLVFTIALLFTFPLGDFPLNDDWSYAYSVKTLVETGVYELTEWLSASLLTQVLWGSLFSKIFGFSFHVLRLSTILLAYVAIIFTYRMVRLSANANHVALLGAFILLSNPLFFSLSSTFMTDVPFLGFLVTAAYFFGRSIKGDSQHSYILAIIFSILATLLRQIGLFLPFAYGAAVLIRDPKKAKHWLKAWAPLVLSISTLFAYNLYIKMSGTTMYWKSGPVHISTLLDMLRLDRLFFNVGTTFVYLGFFLFPLLLFFFVDFLKQGRPVQRNIVMGISAVFLIPFILYLIREKKMMPLSDNIFFNLGLGPKLLNDTYILKINISPSLSSEYLMVFTIVSLGAGFLMSVFFMHGVWSLPQTLRAAKTSEDARLHLSNIVFIGINFVFLILSYFMDRYFIVLIPFTFVYLVRAVQGTHLSKPRLKLTYGFYLVLLIFSIAATHDYLAWNRARWNALNDLMKIDHVPADKIDGGFEFNAWHQTGLLTDSSSDRSWWFVGDDDYMIAFGNRRGYRLYKMYTFFQYLPPKRSAVYVLRKNPSPKFSNAP